MGKYSGFCFQEKVTKYQESILGARTIMDEQKYSLKPKSLSSSVSKAGMVFVFYLKFVRLRDQLTVETRRNLDPCQIDNFVSGLILSLLTDCRPCPAPGPPSASAARQTLQTNQHCDNFLISRKLKLSIRLTIIIPANLFPCQSPREDCRLQVISAHSLKLA